MVEVLNERVAREVLHNSIGERTAIENVVGRTNLFVLVHFQSGLERANHLCQSGTHCTGHGFADSPQVAVFQGVRIVELTDTAGQVQKIFENVEQVHTCDLMAFFIKSHFLVETSSAQFAERILSLVGQFLQGDQTTAGATATVRFPRTTDDCQSFCLGDVFPLNASCFQKRAQSLFENSFVDAHSQEQRLGGNPCTFGQFDTALGFRRTAGNCRVEFQFKGDRRTLFSQHQCLVGDVGRVGEIDTGSSDQLTEYDALRTVDYESSAVGYHRNVAHVGGGLANFAGLNVTQPDFHHHAFCMSHVGFSGLFRSSWITGIGGVIFESPVRFSIRSDEGQFETRREIAGDRRNFSEEIANDLFREAPVGASREFS